MKRTHTPWLVGALLVTFMVVKYFYEGIGAARNLQEIATQELALVQGKCTNPENIDRWLLQQSWFYDEQFTQLAGAFGQSSFSLYERGGKIGQRTEGAFCIAGNDLVVRYFKTRHVPVDFEFRSLSDWTIKLGTKLEPAGDDRYSVQELTSKRMVLSFASDGREHVFYRKH